MNLEGKVAVIVGGEGPLGRATTEKFLPEGAKIAIGWHTPEEWEGAKELIPDKYKGQVIDVNIDASKEEDVEKLMKKAKDTFGSIDIMLHMVGPSHPLHAGMLWETDVARWDNRIDSMLKSAFLCSKHAVKAMLEKGRGRLVFFTSRVTTAYQAGHGAGNVAKAGLITLTDILREELKHTHITTNVIMFSRLDTWKTRTLDKMPAIGNPDPETWVKPKDVAEFLACLCSDECDALSGSTLKVFAQQ